MVIIEYNDNNNSNLIMNFLLNDFQSKNNKFMVEPIDSDINLAEIPLFHIRRLSHNRGLSSHQSNHKLEWKQLL